MSITYSPTDILPDRVNRVGIPTSFASDGTPYTIITHAGPKSEAEAPAFMISVYKGNQVNAAVLACRDLLIAAIRAFVKDKPGHIEWRSRPEVETSGGYAETRLVVQGYARLAVVAPKQEETTMDQKPSVGRQVHYFNLDLDQFGYNQAGPYAATIVKVHTDECVDLYVLPPEKTGGLQTSVPFLAKGQTPLARQYSRWPERV